MSEPPPAYANTQGPPQYGAPPYGGGAPIIIMQQQQQQQQQQPTQQIIVQPSRTNHGLCCLICILTGGLSIPCWICSCITD